MKFLTGDDTGLLKVVRVEAKKVEKFGPKQRGDAAERLCWAGPTDNREARVGVAYASGQLELRDGTSGQVLASVKAAPKVRCLQVLGGGLLAVSADGTARVVRDWCSEEGPAEEEQAEGADDAADAGADVGKLLPPSFTLPAPVASAEIDPCGSNRLAFGGGENDLKVFDLAKEEVTWQARGMCNNFLELKIPVKLATVRWATQLEPARSLITVGTIDGKVRLYDASRQRRPLFEMVIGFNSGMGSLGHAGVADDLPRPVNCDKIVHVQGKGWRLFIGNTTGALREYDLRFLPTAKPPGIQPGRKSHYKVANKLLPFSGGYKGIMGSIRALDVHSSGESVVAVGLGRFAHVFDTKRRKLTSKVYLKQKLCSVLFSSEEKKAAPEPDEEDMTGDEREDGGKAATVDDGPEGDVDEVQEGFSDDEEQGGGAPQDLEADADAVEGEEGRCTAARGRKAKGLRRTKRSVSGGKAVKRKKPRSES